MNYDEFIADKRHTGGRHGFKPKRRQMVPRTRNGGTWTESEYWTRICNALRKTFAAWVPMNVALKAARRPSQRADRPLLKWEYGCAHCHGWFPLKEAGEKGKKLVHVDHITPAGRMRSFEDLPGWIARLTEENPACYQILCTGCHTAKTNAERQARSGHTTSGAFSFCLTASDTTLKSQPAGNVAEQQR